MQLAKAGVDVVILDTDAQATCARFIERRDAAGIEPRIPCVQRTGDVSSTLRDIANRYQIVIVDAGGRDSKELRTALVASQLLITPTQASQADLETLPKVNELVSLARGLNPDLKAHAVLSRAPSNPMIREVEDAKELLAEFDQLVLADSVIRDRKIYRDALLSGNGVIELSNSQAKAEIQLLVQEFFDL
ncbi:ParA family protein [Burkholderia gladioli]|uniref:ParA family protein n=1 Tax=Burkholderia gladioli TaxID=28095 RepID=UPI001F497CB1|nr:ParA family protein [Burkholderia gladioli]